MIDYVCVLSLLYDSLNCFPEVKYLPVIYFNLHLLLSVNY